MTEAQFDILPISKNEAELAERVRAAKTVTTIKLGYRDWRLPSEMLWLGLLGGANSSLEQAEAQDLAEQAEGFREAIEVAKTNLLKFAARTEKPFAPRFGRDFCSFVSKPEDQIAVIGGDWSPALPKLENRNLKERLPCWPKDSGASQISYPPRRANIRNAIDFNLPHPLEAQFGNWRDWILGMRVMLADGSIINTGSKVVKSVAGYDLHKLIVGARGTLGIILEVTVRTFPASSIPEPELEIRYDPPKDVLARRELLRHLWVQRTLPSDFAACVATAKNSILEIDWASSTMWASVPPQDELQRYPGDWVIRSGCGEKNLELTDATQIALMKRAKGIFDPTHKLNPGEMGIF